MINLTTIEAMTVEYCKNLQKFLETIDLSYKDIPATSKILVDLQKAKQSLETLREANATHEVTDNTGKVIGKLYDNEKIGNIMMEANIALNFRIQACESNIAGLTARLII